VLQAGNQRFVIARNGVTKQSPTKKAIASHKSLAMTILRKILADNATVHGSIMKGF